MLEIFQYEFMVRALIAGGMIGIIAPIIGSFLVAKRYSLMADSLAHISLAGIAIGLLLGINPILTAVVTSVLSAILIEKLRTGKKLSGENALAIFLSGGLAVAVVLISIANGFNVDLFSYLFGSITTVREIDLWVILLLGIIILASSWVFYEEFMYIAFDEESARVSGVPVKAINIILVALTAITVSIAMRVVGVLLIGALMVIPVATAMLVGKSFKVTIIISVALGFVSSIVGLILAYYLDLAAGGTIVIFSLLIFGFVSLLRKK